MRPVREVSTFHCTKAFCQVSGIIAFLAWLDERHTTLNAVTQTQVEEFLTVRSAKRWLPQFLSWARERDAAPDVDVPTLHSALPIITAAETEHVHTIRSLSADETIPLDARLAALLLAVYGLPASKTLTLRRGQLRADPSGSIELVIGDHPLRLPEPVTNLAKTHLAVRRPSHK